LFLDPGHERYSSRKIVFERFSLKKVRSSNGLMEERFSVETTIRLFNRMFPIELTLTERGNMRFPVLLGRKFLSRRFVVDPCRKNMSARGKFRTVIKAIQMSGTGVPDKSNIQQFATMNIKKKPLKLVVLPVIRIVFDEAACRGGRTKRHDIRLSITPFDLVIEEEPSRVIYRGAAWACRCRDSADRCFRNILGTLCQAV